METLDEWLASVSARPGCGENGINEVEDGHESDHHWSEHVDLSDNIHICSGQDAGEAIPFLTSDSAGDETFITGGLSTSREL